MNMGGNSGSAKDLITFSPGKRPQSDGLYKNWTPI